MSRDDFDASYWDYEPTHIFDRKDFQAYADQIKKVLENKPQGLTVREIHDAVGRDKTRWTMLALEFLQVEERGASPCRYVLRELPQLERVPYNQWLSQMLRMEKALKAKRGWTEPSPRHRKG